MDVADLTSGVTTVILAGKEQLLGRQGHYGALSKADAPVPSCRSDEADAAGDGASFGWHRSSDR